MPPEHRSPTREGFIASFKITPAVRVLARRLRHKNCLVAIFGSLLDYPEDGILTGHIFVFMCFALEHWRVPVTRLTCPLLCLLLRRPRKTNHVSLLILFVACHRGSFGGCSPFRVVADVWEKDVWDFQAKSGSSGSFRFCPSFPGENRTSKTSGSPRLAGVLRGNTIRGNTTRNSERKMAL